MQYDHIKISQILEVAVVSARLAGQKAMELISYTKSSKKSADELVTQADIACQDLIISRIKETFPDHGFIAEEGSEGKVFKQPPRGEPFWWVIDPIDGTNNYAHGILEFCVSIGVIADGEPIVGAIYQPATDSMFTGAVDMDAQLNNSTITAGDEKLSRFCSVGLDSHFGNDLPEWARNIMLKTRYRNLGTTATHLAMAASGGFAGMLTRYAKLWDIAAGVIIAKRAGAIVSNWKSEKLFPIDMDSYDNARFNILAANPKAHKQLLEIMKGRD